MTSFKFPPPPPPPPKASSSSDTHQPYASQRGGHNRGRADGGRVGGGGGPSRGGGNQSFRGNARGGQNQGNARGAMNSRGPRGIAGTGYQNNRGGGHQGRGSNLGYGQQYQQSPPPTNELPTAPPARAHVTPSFSTQSQMGRQAQPQFDPNALVQAMSFMSTPAGQQSMAAFANHMASVGTTTSQYSQSPPRQDVQSEPRYSPMQHAGQKRKLNGRNSLSQPQPPRNPPQPSTKPPRAKAAVPPPVPSFGFSLPASPVMRPSRASKGEGKNETKKRKVNLGLTQRAILQESSDEEDVDEEAKYAEKLKGGGFAFEHEGELISIQTAAEVAAWIKDRRRHFPTHKRIMEKAEEAAKKRTSELEFLRKLKGRAPKPNTSVVKEKPAKLRDENKQDDKRREDDIRRQEELAALRRKLHKSMLTKQAKSSTVDLGLGYDSETESDEESSVLSDSSVISSSEESLDHSDSESDESDEAPEPASSKVGPPPINVPPPAPLPALPQATSGRPKVCSDWERHGRCSYSNKCKFAHPPREVKRVGLYDMMVEQELVKADQLALDAIKYLGQHGFLG